MNKYVSIVFAFSASYFVAFILIGMLGIIGEHFKIYIFPTSFLLLIFGSFVISGAIGVLIFRIFNAEENKRGAKK